jgi:hypothetical protein
VLAQVVHVEVVRELIVDDRGLIAFLNRHARR